MRANWVCVHAKERDSDESTIAPETQNGISELEGGVVFVRVPLVEVNICTRACQHSKETTYKSAFVAYGNATPCRTRLWSTAISINSWRATLAVERRGNGGGLT